MAVNFARRAQQNASVNFKLRGAAYGAKCAVADVRSNKSNLREKQ